MIDYSTDEYAIDGYVVDTDAEQVDNWLSYRHHIDEPKIVEMIRSKFSRIAFLNNLNVDEGKQGQGIGSDALESFISEVDSFGAQAILLLADTNESQIEGFDLVKWYTSWGFSIIHTTASGPLMMSDLRNTHILKESAISYRKFQGLGGLCGQAAIAINRAIFQDQGRIVGCFNRAFYDAGRLTGHVAVFANGNYWDADATPKELEDIESWGMLDLADPDYQEFADEYSIDWNDDTADDVITVRMTEQEVIAAFGSDRIEQMMRKLGWRPVEKRI